MLNKEEQNQMEKNPIPSTGYNLARNGPEGTKGDKQVKISQ